ncbi:Os06g0346600, partial [Oryza sativa Japonica Group]
WASSSKAAGRPARAPGEQELRPSKSWGILIFGLRPHWRHHHHHHLSGEKHQTLQLSCLHRFLPKVLNLILRLQEHFRWVNLVLATM